MGIIVPVIKGVNDFKTIDPEGAKLWHPTKNGDVLPEDVYWGTNCEYWFCMSHVDETLGEFYFEWKWKINIMVKSSAKCPYLTNSSKWLYKGFNDLHTLEKELVDSEWDWDKNTVLPSEIRRCSRYNAHWKCSFGHEYQRIVSDRVNHKYCPICARQMKSSFPEQAILFYLRKQYKKVINGYKDLFLDKMEMDIFIPELNIGIEYDGFRGHSTNIKNDLIKNELCRNNGVRLIRIRENILPDLKDDIEIIHCEANLNSLDSAIKELFSLLEITGDINTKRDFYEIKKNYELLILSNSLFIKNPGIAKEWDYEKNLNISPKSIYPNSNEKYWWKCELGHSWQSTPNKRVFYNRGCPYCTNQKVLPGFNDLGTTRPDLLLFWDYNKNTDILPVEVTRAGVRHIFWKCPDCGQEWKESLNHMERRKYPCKKCKLDKRISK